MTDPTEIKIMGVYLIEEHPYTFRRGKKALITGVKTISTPDHEPRICYEIAFPDGFVDYVPLCDMHHYKMEEIP